MTALPAFCPRCKSIFPFRAIAIGAGAQVGLSNITTNCPACGFGGATVSDGVYRATQDAIELISGPDSTREILQALKTLAERLSSGQIDQAEAQKQAYELSPKFAATFDVFIKLGLPALALLIAMIGVYLQYEGNKSSGDDAKKILEAITEQTFSIKEMKGKGGVKDNSSASPSKKSNIKAAPIKGPSCRRANVNRERRATLKKYREVFGQSRTR
jgi:hypothetical protein